MKRTHARLTAVAACLALATAAAIPAAAGAASIPLKVKSPGALKVNKPRKAAAALGSLANLNGRYGSLSSRVRNCAAAAADLKAAKSIRTKAFRNVGRASLKSLGTRKQQMSGAVVRLSKAAQRCAVSTTVTNTVVIPGPGGSGGTSGSAGAGGSSGQAGAGGANSPGVVSAGITLPDVLGGSALDVGGLLGGTTLPAVPNLVSLGDLDTPTCLVDDAVCVGVDVPALEGALTSLVGANGPLAQLLGINLSGLLSQITALLDTGQLGSLLRVERVGDQVLRLVPTGPLAGLAGLTGIPSVPVVQVQVG